MFGPSLKRSWLALWSMAYRLAEAEPELLPRIAATLGPGPIVGFDVGAGPGVYARAMARICDHVLAFEPHAPQAAFLRDCALDRVEVIDAAASSQPGSALLRDRQGGDVWRRPEAMVELPDPTTGEYATPEGWSQPCATVTLDGYIAALDRRWPDFGMLVKIDVEGHELEVLLGAKKLLVRRHVALVIEIEARHNPAYANVFSLLGASGFCAFRHRRGRLMPANSEDVAAMQDRRGGRFPRLRGYANNYVFLRV